MPAPFRGDARLHRAHQRRRAQHLESADRARCKVPRVPDSRAVRAMCARKSASAKAPMDRTTRLRRAAVPSPRWPAAPTGKPLPGRNPETAPAVHRCRRTPCSPPFPPAFPRTRACDWCSRRSRSASSSRPLRHASTMMVPRKPQPTMPSFAFFMWFLDESGRRALSSGSSSGAALPKPAVNLVLVTEFFLLQNLDLVARRLDGAGVDGLQLAIEFPVFVEQGGELAVAGRELGNQSAYSGNMVRVLRKTMVDEIYVVAALRAYPRFWWSVDCPCPVRGFYARSCFGPCREGAPRGCDSRR